jgi:hypothetical protein
MFLECLASIPTQKTYCSSIVEPLAEWNLKQFWLLVMSYRQNYCIQNVNVPKEQSPYVSDLRRSDPFCRRLLNSEAQPGWILFGSLTSKLRLKPLFSKASATVQARLSWRAHRISAVTKAQEP